MSILQIHINLRAHGTCEHLKSQLLYIIIWTMWCFFLVRRFGVSVGQISTVSLKQIVTMYLRKRDASYLSISLVLWYVCILHKMASSSSIFRVNSFTCFGIWLDLITKFLFWILWLLFPVCRESQIIRVSKYNPW